MSKVRHQTMGSTSSRGLLSSKREEGALTIYSYKLVLGKTVVQLSVLAAPFQLPLFFVLVTGKWSTKFKKVNLRYYEP